MSIPRIPFEPDRGDVNPDPALSSAEADELASGVDPDDIGVDDELTPSDAERDPEA
jgi:hypothetical protein